MKTVIGKREVHKNLFSKKLIIHIVKITDLKTIAEKLYKSFVGIEPNFASKIPKSETRPFKGGQIFGNL